MVRMDLRTGTIFIVLAAAGGAAAVHALSPQTSRAPALDLGSPRSLPRSQANAELVHAGRRPEAPLAGRRGPVVYVAGEVMRPGVYRVASDARAVDALHMAGGPTKLADLVAVNLAAPVQDGSEIVVPAKGLLHAGPPSEVGTRTRTTRSHSRPRQAAHHRRKRSAALDSGDSIGGAPPTLDVNSADAAALETLPGIGPALAERIVTFRDANGAFASSDELLDVAGMTQNKVDELAPYVTFR